MTLPARYRGAHGFRLLGSYDRDRLSRFDCLSDVSSVGLVVFASQPLLSCFQSGLRYTEEQLDGSFTAGDDDAIRCSHADCRVLFLRVSICIMDVCRKDSLITCRY